MNSSFDFSKKNLLEGYRKHKDVVEEIMDYGERITHLYPNNCFYAHLSLYELALQFIKPGSKILDAGSGAGYGTAYLRMSGDYDVLGIEVDNQAVQFSKKFFDFDGLEYRRMDLEDLQGFPPYYFDFVYCSNVLEHLENVRLFLNNICNYMKEDGQLYIVVPVIASESQFLENIAISQHLNIWSPRQWYHILRKYFMEVECFRHINKPGVTIGDLNNSPEDETNSERDYLLKRVEPDQIGVTETAISAVFLAKHPVSKEARSLLDERMEYVDGSFSRPKPIISQLNCISHIGEIVSGTIVTQSFLIEGTISQIDVMFATFMRINSGKILFQLKEEGREGDLYKTEFRTSDLKDNNWHEIRFGRIDIKRKKFLYIAIESPDSSSGNAVTVRASDKKIFDKGCLLINDKKMPYDITFRAYR